eukprot:Gb_40324 [translate_table: standard]
MSAEAKNIISVEEDMESKRLRDWLKFHEEHLLNENEDFEEVGINSELLSGMITSLENEIGIPHHHHLNHCSQSLQTEMKYSHKTDRADKRIEQGNAASTKETGYVLQAEVSRVCNTCIDGLK